MPKGKHTTIDLDNREELGALPDRSKRSNLNPQIHVEEVGPPRIRENPKRLSSKISSLTREDRSHKEVGDEESSSDQSVGVNVALSAGKDESSGESSPEESRPTKKAKTNYRVEAEFYSWIMKPLRKT